MISLMLQLLQGKSKSQWWFVNGFKDSKFSPLTSWDLFAAAAAKFAAAQLDLPLTFVLAVLLPWPELEQGIAYIWGWWLLGASLYGLEPRLVTWPSPLRHVKLALPVKGKQTKWKWSSTLPYFGIVLISGRKKNSQENHQLSVGSIHQRQMWAKMSTPVCIVGKRPEIEDALTWWSVNMYFATKQKLLMEPSSYQVTTKASLDPNSCPFFNWCVHGHPIGLARWSSLMTTPSCCIKVFPSLVWISLIWMGWLAKTPPPHLVLWPLLEIDNQKRNIIQTQKAVNLCWILRGS